MTTDDDTLRRLIREELAAALPAALPDALPAALAAALPDVLRDVFVGLIGARGRRPPSPELSEKRRAAAKVMWENMKSQRSTGLPTATPKKKRASKKVHAQSPEQSKGNGADASLVQANLLAPEEQTPSSRAFLAYAGAYRMRYGEFPVRNAKTNALLKQLVARLGDGEAPGVAEYYLTLADKLYAGSGHCLTLLLRDAEKLRTMWKQGVTPGNGAGAAPAKPWWEGSWSALEAQGDELGIDRDENPQLYRAMVLRAAYVAGRLPEEVALKLGLRVDTGPDQGII